MIPAVMLSDVRLLTIANSTILIEITSWAFFKPTLKLNVVCAQIYGGSQELMYLLLIFMASAIKSLLCCRIFTGRSPS